MVDSHGCGAETAQESGKWPSLVVSVVGDVMEVVHHLGGVILKVNHMVICNRVYL